MADSILSTEERKVAEALRAGDSVEEIAEARDQTVETVERTVDRVREKTDRALVTLATSPFTAERAGTLPEAERERLVDAIGQGGEEGTSGGDKTSDGV